MLGFYRWHINASRSKVDQILSDLYDFREYAYSKSCLTRLIGFFVRQEAFIRQAKALWYQEHRTLAGFDLNNYSHIMELHENKLRRHFAKYVRKKFLKYKKKTKDVRFSRQMLETKDGR